MSPENKLIVLYSFTVAKSGHKQHRQGTERQHKRILQVLQHKRIQYYSFVTYFFISEHNA